MKRKKPRSANENSASPGKSPYEPTQREQIKLLEYEARKAADTAPRLKVQKFSEPVWVGPDHPDHKVGYTLLMEALGTTDPDFTHGLIGHMLTATAQDGRGDEAGINFMLAVIKGVKPTDQFEAMLAAQMAAVHTATMIHAGLLYRTETPQHQDIIASGFNKCARTFATLMETLKRYRTGGEQKVTVQHVSVGDGGRAIVGNVTQSLAESARAKPVSSAAALTDARQPAMPIIEEPKRARVPLRRRQKYDGRSSA